MFIFFLFTNERSATTGRLKICDAGNVKQLKHACGPCSVTLLSRAAEASAATLLTDEIALRRAAFLSASLADKTLIFIPAAS